MPGIVLKVFDPIVKQKNHPLFNNMIYSKDPYDAAKDADVLVVLTEWNEFRKLSLERVRQLMRGSVIVDGRNIYDPERVKKLGFTYKGTGRGI